MPIYFLLILLLSSCTSFLTKELQYNYYGTDTLEIENKSLENQISSYRIQIDSQMNQIVSYTEVDLLKEQPESNLGNWAADAVQKQLIQYTGQKVDFSILNYGGLRTSGIPKGPIKKRQIFELMPFDNMLVVVEMKGEELFLLWEHMMKKGGWPQSAELKLIIDADGTVSKSSTISGATVDRSRVYKVGTIDYLANGGDQSTFFISKTKSETGVILRDAVIAYLIDLNRRGVKVNTQKENRIEWIKK